MNPRLVVFQTPAKQDTEPKAVPPNLGEILAHAFWMEKKGYKAHTVKGAVSSLNTGSPLEEQVRHIKFTERRED